MQPNNRRQKPPPPGPGWVYVLTCPDFPGCCKIGGTSRTPTHRALELVMEYRTTSAFTVVAQHAAADWWIVEQKVHRMLADRRLPRSELFRCSPAEASDAIAAVARFRARSPAPAEQPNRARFSPPLAYPATSSVTRPWYRQRHDWRPQTPLRLVLLLFVLLLLWLAVRQSPSQGEFVPLRAGTADPGGGVRVIYP